MKIFTIVIHVLPTELSELHRLLSDLKKSIHMLNNSMDTSNLKFNIFVTLNISDKLMEFTDKSVFLSYYHELYQEFNNYLSLNFNTSDDLNIAGTTAQKRYVIHTDDESDVFIFLDPDIYFPSDLLYYMVISENIGTDGQWFFNIFWQKELISQKAMVFMPAFSNPKEKPPIPEKISNTVTLRVLS